MGFLADLRYFGPRLGMGRGASLLETKVRKAARKSRVHRALRRGEADRALLSRLGLPEDAGARRERLRKRLEPMTALGLPDGPPDAGAVEACAEAVLAGRELLFGREVETGWPPRWDWRWEGTESAALLAADLRSTWEVQRLQGILPLARAARLAADSERRVRYAEAYVRALLDFYRAQPGPAGTAWESALELGLRLTAVAQGLVLVAGSEAFAASDVVLVKLVDRHARALAADLSLDKVVRGNHLLGELAGLLTAGRLFPEAAPAWWDEVPVAEVLEAEILRQFHPDGVSVEQSLTYEKFVLEFLVVAGEASALRGAPFSGPVRERMLAAARHLEVATAPDGTLPRVGDCDSGRGADWGEDDPHRPGGLPARIRRVFGPAGSGGPAPAAPSGSPAEASAGGHRGPAETGTPGGATAVHFPQGGHAVVLTPGGDFLFIRGGPFGWGIPGPASHSHADLLAPVLHLGGEPVWIDPGTAGYRVPAPLRDGLRGWEAHTAPAFEPPRGPAPAGTFRWRDITLVASLEAKPGPQGPEIDGEVRWEDRSNPLRWRRCIRYNQLEKAWLLLDRFSQSHPGPVTWAFRFAPGIQLERLGTGGVYRVTLPSGRRWRLELSPGEGARIEEAPVAPAYGTIVTAPVLRLRLGAPPPELRVFLTAEA
jgi:hypothetical protein